MNKARPLLLERPGFFSAVRVGAGRGREVPRGGGEDRRWAGERAAAGRGRELLRGRGEARSVLRGAMRRKADGGAQGHSRARRTSQGAQGIPGRAEILQGVCRGTAERAGHRRACRAPQGARGHRRAHGALHRAHRDTAGRAGTPQSARGHPWPQAAREDCQRPKKSPPAAARRGQKNLFLLREKNFEFFGKNS